MIKRSPPYLHPLPLLKPQNPPAKVLNLCKQQAQLQTLNLPAVPQLEDENLQYRSFQRNQCLQCPLLMDRLRASQGAVNELIKANQQLQQKVLMLQDERWKKHDYSGNSSARLRSKSAKPQKKIPTIEVKVPIQPKDNQILKEDQHYQKAKLNRQNQQISSLLQQLQSYRQKIKQLTQQNQSIKQQLTNNSQNQAKNNSLYFRDRASLPLENRQPTRSYSLLTENPHQNSNKIKNPYVTDFSPLPKNSHLEVTQTVKKDFSNEPANGFQMEIKRLNNEVLYKNLLLDKIKVENMKQKGVLQRHLHLSVQESKMIAEETTSVCNQFKSELIKLTKQLEASKIKCAKLQAQLSRHRSRQDFLIVNRNINNQATLETRQLLQILKTRRSEHLSG